MTFNDVKAIAGRLGVSMHAACLRAELSYSTQYRWSQGTTPTPENLAKLRAAIIAIAHERGTLPAELAGEVPGALRSAPAEVETPHEIVQGIKHDLRRLERSLKNGAAAAS